MAGHKSRSYGRLVPDVISSSMMLPLNLSWPLQSRCWSQVNVSLSVWLCEEQRVFFIVQSLDEMHLIIRLVLVRIFTAIMAHAWKNVHGLIPCSHDCHTRNWAKEGLHGGLKCSLAHRFLARFPKMSLEIYYMKSREAFESLLHKGSKVDWKWMILTEGQVSGSLIWLMWYLSAEVLCLAGG